MDGLYGRMLLGKMVLVLDVTYAVLSSKFLSVTSRSPQEGGLWNIQLLPSPCLSATSRLCPWRLQISSPHSLLGADIHQCAQDVRKFL